MDLQSPELEVAIAKAEKLATRIEAGDLQPAFDALEGEIHAYEAESGESVEDLIPAAAEEMAFSLKDLRKGEEFARAVLCSRRDDEVRSSIEGALQGGLPALVPAVAGVLALPPLGFAIAAAIAAIVLTRGLDRFCTETNSALGDD